MDKVDHDKTWECDSTLATGPKDPVLGCMPKAASYYEDGSKESPEA